MADFLGAQTSRWPNTRGPFEITTEWAMVDGRAECVGIYVTHGATYVDDNPPSDGHTVCEIEPGSVRFEPFAKGGPSVLGADEMRSIRFGEVIADHRRKLRKTLLSFYDLERVDDFNERARSFVDAWQRASTRGSLRGREPDHFVKVAEIYRAAWAAGEPPTQAVADHFHVSKSAAAKWVARCRHELNLLGKTERGKPGGIEPRRRTKR